MSEIEKKSCLGHLSSVPILNLMKAMTMDPWAATIEGPKTIARLS